jgi:hypothetical protein
MSASGSPRRKICNGAVSAWTTRGLDKPRSDASVPAPLEAPNGLRTMS